MNGYYFSSPAHEKLLPFPGGKQIPEDRPSSRLRAYPGAALLVLCRGRYRYGHQNDKSTLSLAAGNSALILLKNEEYILVKNDSCAEYWLLVVASGDPRP